MRKLIGFLFLAGGLFAALTGAWYFGAGKVDETITAYQQQLSHKGISANCQDREVRGYPFRLGIFCSSVSYADPVRGVTLSTRGLRSAAQLYRPGHVVGEVDGPMNLSAPGLAPMVVDWSGLQASSRVGTNGLRRVSIVSNGVSIAANDLGLISELATSREIQMHLRAGDEGAGGDAEDLEASFSAEGWQINDGGSGTIPSIDLALNMLVQNGLSLVGDGDDPISVLRSQGGSLELRQFELNTSDGGRILLSGPLQLDKRGRLSGEVSVDLEDPAKLIDYVANIFPPITGMTADLRRFLDSVATSANGRQEIRGLKLTLRDGSVFLGFIEIGRLPRLF